MKLRQLTSVSIFIARLLLIALVVPRFAQAFPLLSTADIMEGKSWAISVSGQSIEKDPVFEIDETNAIQVPVSGGSAAIFSTTHAEIETEEDSDSVVAVLAYKPREGLQYNFKFGQVQSFDLEFSSGNQVNTLEALKSGILWGMGIGGRIRPGSIVSTAISWQLDYTHKRIDLDRFESGGDAVASNLEFEETEYQGSINFSRRWKSLEPFGGLKLIRTTAKLKDLTTKEKVSGTTDGVSPFIGVQWSFADREMVVVEASFAEEESVSAALKLQF